MRRLSHLSAQCFAACLTFAAVIPGEGDARQSSDGYNKGQMLLFNTPHLDNVVAKSRLHYKFEQSGSLTHELSDNIVLSVTAINADGGKDVEPQFLSGSNQRKFDAVEGFRGNPLLLYFLEWDIEKMHDNHTMNNHRIHRQFLQHKIRNAFATDTEFERESVSLGDGKKLKTRRVSLQPLAGAKDNPKYMHMWNKRYDFILADVPGGIYQIVTQIPGEKPGDRPKERTEITFDRIDPAEAHRKAK